MTTTWQVPASLFDPVQTRSSPAELQTYGGDYLKSTVRSPSLIVFPKDIDEISKVLQICNTQKIAVVPSGGRTGLSGGASASKGEVVLALERMNKIIELNLVDRTLVLEAGVITALAQDEAKKHHLYFPIDFGSKGSSQIGGNIATNAGGIRVMRYGNMREMVLGLKVVTAAGEILNLNGALFKNQTGYDLKNLIIGSEGTLAVIAEATLKLADAPKEISHALLAVEELPEVLEIFKLVRAKYRGLSVFEFFAQNSLEKVLLHNPAKNPFQVYYPYYILLEIEDLSKEQIEPFFLELLESENVKDVVVPQTTSQTIEFFTLRELIPDTLNRRYTVHKNDISLPVPKICDFLKVLFENQTTHFENCEIVVFGHAGDGNLHLNIVKPDSMTDQHFFSNTKRFDARTFELIRSFGGSISAEHGVGVLKKDYLHFSRSNEEIGLMRKIKLAFDPNNILNPGKIFDL